MTNRIITNGANERNARLSGDALAKNLRAQGRHTSLEIDLIVALKKVSDEICQDMSYSEVVNLDRIVQDVLDKAIVK